MQGTMDGATLSGKLKSNGSVTGTLSRNSPVLSGSVSFSAGDYNHLQNKPNINSTELLGNKTGEELGLLDSVNYLLNEEIEKLIII